MNSGNSVSSSSTSDNRDSESSSTTDEEPLICGNVSAEGQIMANEWGKVDGVNVLEESWSRGRIRGEKNTNKSVSSNDVDIPIFKTLADGTLIPASSPSVGLINEGCLCYLNCLLQLLFHLSYFRTAVYRMPDDDSDKGTCSISQALKEIFFSMQEGTRPVHTKKLTSAFGWCERDLYTQQDIQEMATILRDNLEEKMKNTVTEGAINRLFGGVGEQVVVTIDKAHRSLRRDVFYDIHLPLSPRGTLIDSIRSLVAKEKLVGDNKYRVEADGMEPQYKDAEKSYKFCRFPPVIWFHLKRFEMNLMSPLLEMRKVNSRLEFPLELDLQEFEMGDSQNNEEEEKEESDGQLMGKKEDTGKKRKEELLDENHHYHKQQQEQEQEQQEQQQKYFFSTDSQPIYDLQGVIVHRGSVQSGHYYCYIRKWDHIKGRFTHWFEFDDEKVSLVNEDVAVSNNFGGNMVRHGRQYNTMAIHNAYILSYVRRADCSKVLEPPPENIISQRVKDVFYREKLESDRRQLEEKCQRQRLTLFILTNDIIFEYVQRCQNKIFPADMYECERIGIKLEVKKEDTLGLVYKAVASHKRLRALELVPGQFCLWFSHSGQDCWPLEQILLERRGPDTAMYTFLSDCELNALNVCRCVYIQLPTTLKPFSITSANWLIKNIEYHNKINFFGGSVFLDPPVAPHSIALELDLERSHMSSWIRVSFCLYDTNDEKTCLDDILYLKHHYTFLLEVSESRQMRRIDYYIEVGSGATGLLLNRFYLNVLSVSLQKIKGKGYFHKGSFLKRGTSDVLIFFKYFNHVRCCVAYLGAVLLPWTVTIGDCENVFRKLVGEENTITGPLQFFEEKPKEIKLLQSNDTLNISFFESTCMLVVQRENAIHVPSSGNMLTYIRTVSRAVFVRAAQIKFINLFSLHSFSYSRGKYDVSGDVLDGENRLNNSTGYEVVDCENSSVVELVSASFSYEDCSDKTFYPLRKYLTLQYFICVMDIQWSYEEICEAICTASGHDPNFIRLYSNKYSLEAHIFLQPDPAPSCSFLDFFIGKEKNQVLFFEVLQEPRRIVKARPCFIVTICTEDNINLYTENIVMQNNVVYGELVRGSLERFVLALAKRRRSTSAALINDVNSKNTTNKYSSDVDGGGGGMDFETVNSSQRKSNNINDFSKCTAVRDCAVKLFDDATRSFTIGTHYLVLVIDSYKIVKEIIEVPLPSDGSCVCKTHVPFDEEPVTVLLVPAAPLKENEYRIAACYGICENIPTVSGQPFVLTFNRTTTIAEVRELLLKRQAVAPDMEAVETDLLLFSDTITELCKWNDPLYNYVRAVATPKGGAACTLMLNCSRLRVKSALQGVALKSPALQIARE